MTTSLRFQSPAPLRNRLGAESRCLRDVKRQLGLDDERSWIATIEVNRFQWPGPDLVPVGRRSRSYLFGKLPMPLLRQVVAQLQANIRSGRLRVVKRTE